MVLPQPIEALVDETPQLGSLSCRSVEQQLKIVGSGVDPPQCAVNAHADFFNRQAQLLAPGNALSAQITCELTAQSFHKLTHAPFDLLLKALQVTPRWPAPELYRDCFRQISDTLVHSEEVPVHDVELLLSLYW